MKARFIVSLLSLFFISCGSTTSITGSWKSDKVNPSGTYGKVFIAALTAKPEVQNVVENHLASSARAQGIEAVVAHEVFSRTFSQESQPTKDDLLKAVRDSGANAIFTVVLRDKESETRYNPGSSTYYAPMSYGYYGRFNNYYNTMYPVTYDPGYYSTDKIYYLESNLYDASTEELIWSAQSKTVNPSNLESFSEGYTKSMIKQLTKDGILAN